MVQRFVGYLVTNNGGSMAEPVSHCSVCDALVMPGHEHPEEKIERLERTVEQKQQGINYVSQQLKDAARKRDDLIRKIWDLEEERNTEARRRGWVIEP